MKISDMTRFLQILQRIGYDDNEIYAGYDGELCVEGPSLNCTDAEFVTFIEEFKPNVRYEEGCGGVNCGEHCSSGSWVFYF